MPYQAICTHLIRQYRLINGDRPIRDSSGSAHEGSIHDDMIDKILTVLPRGNIYQTPPLVPGDDTETLSIRKWRGKSTYPSGPLKVHNWPNPVN